MTVYSTDELPPCPLWDYATEIYSEKKVSDACLRLQDRHEIDVNLLLFCLWSGAFGWSTLTAIELSQALDISAGWQLPIVVPLRTVRNGLKNSSSPAGEKFKQALRKNVLESELYAERLELKMLGKLINRPAKNSKDEQACAANAAENLTAYLRGEVERLTPNDIADILIIWQTAFLNAKDELLMKPLTTV
ncbi:MAG: TIGR02444 family protein [Sneathiella sp.]|nr:TIGR02444 family protein [Sneathiella sp.]